MRLKKRRLLGFDPHELAANGALRMRSGVFAISLVCLLTTTAAHAQVPAVSPDRTMTYDSDYLRDFTAAHGTVGTGRTLINGWTDLQGEIYSVSGNRLHAISSDAYGYFYDLALRPAAENAAPNVEGTMDVPTGIPSPNTATGLVLRFQRDRTFYLFELSQNALIVFKMTGGRTAARLGSVPVQPNTVHPYSLTADAVNAGTGTSSGVALSVSATDTRTGKRIGSLSVFDGNSPILEGGAAGVDSWVADSAPETTQTSYTHIAFFRLPDTVLPITKASPKIGFIGDSITTGYNEAGRTITPGVNDAAALTIQKLSQTKAAALADSGIAWSAYNQAVDGTTTSDWQPGDESALESKAKAAFAGAFGQPDPKANPGWVVVTLGTNDVRSDARHRFTAKRHRQNLQALTADLVAGGYNVILNEPPSFVVPTRFSGVLWDAASLRLLRSYLPADQAVVAAFAKTAPGRVFLGDTSAFSVFAVHPALFQEHGTGGGLHPNGTGGTDTLAAGWARAFLRAATSRG